MDQIIDENLLMRYLKGEVSDQEKAQVDQWSSESAVNEKVLEQLYFVFEASNRLMVMKSVQPDQSLKRLKHRILKKERSKRIRSGIQWMQRIAAILFLPVLLLSVWLFQRQEATAIQYIEMSTHPGIVSSCILPDGSKVWLNSGSWLRYPSVFRNGKREVEILGEGYFDIEKQSDPFMIKAGPGYSLEVLGTTFNVSAYNDDSEIELTLIEGKVKLHLIQNNQTVGHTLQSGEKASYNKNHHSLRIAQVDPAYDIAWKDGFMIFRNHPMKKVIQILSRHYNVRFIVNDDKVMDSEITGKFSNEQLSQVLEYLRIASGINYHIIPGKVMDEKISPDTIELWK